MVGRRPSYRRHGVDASVRGLAIIGNPEDARCRVEPKLSLILRPNLPGRRRKSRCALPSLSPTGCTAISAMRSSCVIAAVPAIKPLFERTRLSAESDIATSVRLSDHAPGQKQLSEILREPDKAAADRRRSTAFTMRIKLRAHDDPVVHLGYARRRPSGSFRLPTFGPRSHGPPQDHLVTDCFN